MPKRISNNQQDEVKRLLLEGYTQQEISEQTHIGIRTIVKIKKELIENNPKLAQNLVDNKYNKKITKCEEKYLKKIQKEQVLFEDLEEGWVYHLTREQLKDKQSSRWWSFIVYEESGSKDWKLKLINLHCELAISPLHDKDVWTHDSPAIVDKETGEIIEEKGSRYKSGEPKKAHWHCIIKFDKSVSYKEANDIIRPITNGPYIQKCMSLKGQYEYFIHLNDMSKYQYEKDEIERYNNFVIETTKSDRIVMIDEMGRIVSEKGFSNLEELRKYYEGQYEYINVLALKCYFFEKLTQVNYRKLYPEGRVQRVRMVKDKER